MPAMSMSRPARIILLLAIDVLFFFVEIIVGYAVGSLALVADSFHMLNDVLSLVVALYAIKFSAKDRTSQYSYGWHRAEILAALINGVFLLALCFSIFLEAIQRFFTAPEISNPRLVVIVGSLGLASNLVGLFLFHEHGHSHGHDHGNDTGSITPSEGLVSGVTSREQSPSAAAKKAQRRLTVDERERRERSSSFDNMGHPAAIRASISNLARSPSPNRRRESRSSRSQSRSARPLIAIEDDETVADTIEADENTPLINNKTIDRSDQSSSGQATPTQVASSHGHGHSHAGSMNMRALVLHVIGDALGNVGVIATGLIIWLSTWSFKYYFDPVISLVITVIIFHSALPLVLSTSSILLQGVPPEVSLENVHNAILLVPGVLAVHELHVWQLSESRVVGSVHVVADRNEDFMHVAAQIHEVLHRHGIHSATIQPEYRKQPEDLNKSCLIPCPPGQACSTEENACCPPPPADV